MHDDATPKLLAALLSALAVIVALVLCYLMLWPPSVPPPPRPSGVKVPTPRPASETAEPVAGGGRPARVGQRARAADPEPTDPVELSFADWMALAGALTERHAQFEIIECWPGDRVLLGAYDPPTSFALPAVQSGEALVFIGQRPLTTTLNVRGGMRPVATLTAGVQGGCTLRPPTAYDLILVVDGWDELDRIPEHVQACWAPLVHLGDGRFTGRVSPDLDVAPRRCPVDVSSMRASPRWVDVTSGQEQHVRLTPARGAPPDTIYDLMDEMDRDAAQHAGDLEVLADELETLLAEASLTAQGRAWVRWRAERYRQGIWTDTMLQVEQSALDALDALE